jgi:TonB-linked SusC/RagA family outer membrane protein
MKLNSFTAAVQYLYGLLPPKLLLVMKLTSLLIMIVLLQASAKSFSQVTLNERNTSLEKVLKTIKKQTGYDIFYDYNDVKNAVVNIQVTDVSLDQALSICLKDLPITFKVVDKNVVLKKKEEPSLLNKMFDMISLSFNISGIVGDEKGPLAGVSVFVKGTSHATVTDDKGEFTLSDIHDGDILVFHSIGYKTQEVIVKNARVFNIKLDAEVSSLDQVVIIGYGTTEKKDLTGAVSTVAKEDIEDIPFGTIDNALAGKAAGVEVTKTDGSPGGAVRIQIRGSSSLLGGNDPLYVIDGVPLQVQSDFQSPGYDVSSPIGNNVTNLGGVSAGLSTSFTNGLNSLGGLNVDDIESITILKDASSTAIYGSKGANGVVIITTKRGKKDMKPVITASYYTTVSSPINPRVLDAPQYKTLMTEAAQNDANYLNGAGLPLAANDNEILNEPDSFFGNANTNWIKDVTRTTVADNAELSVQGGGNSSKYFSSISYNTTPGVVDGTDYQRVAGKINLENEIDPKFRLSWVIPTRILATALMPRHLLPGRIILRMMLRAIILIFQM